MATKAPWSSQYMIEQTSSLTGDPTFAPATKRGLEGTGAANGVFRVGLLSSPHIIPSSGTIEHPTTTGLAEMFTTLDFSQVVGEPASVSLEMPLNAYNLSLFLLLLFQGGCTEVNTAGKNTLRAVAYTSSAPSYYVSVVRVMVDDFATKPNVDTLSHILYGGLCTSLTITGAENDILKLTAEIKGSWALAAAATDLPNFEMLINNAANNWSSFIFMTAGQEANRIPIKFQDCTTKIGGNAVDFDNFSITISNNAQHRYYANSSINAWVLGRLTGDASVRVPWGDANYGGNSPLTDFVDGNDYLFELYTEDMVGTPPVATTDNSLDLKMNIRATNTSISTDPEVQTELSFAPVYDGTNAAFDINVGYNATYLDRIA